jgi:AmmeMemoRadiSam system protein B/AmmeMemoRadiSam system protein A
MINIKMKKFWLFLILAILIGGIFWLVFYGETDETSQLTSMLENLDKSKDKSIRQPAVVGQFYPGDKEVLANQIEKFLEKVELPEIEEQPFDITQGKIRALIVPHAGYVYSGPVAAYGFKAIKGQEIKRVVLIGNSHHQYFSGAVIDGNDFWQTPLGQVEIDTQLRDILAKTDSGLRIDSAPHQPEHSLEVEVPFLQKVLKDFKILPILIGQISKQDLERLSQALAQQLNEKTLLVASSDMSHYPPYEQAVYADKKVIEAILTGQVDKLQETISQLEKENIPNLATCLCGQAAVEVVMKVAQLIGAQKIELLKYANSGDSAIGDKSQVVGYSAIAFFTTKSEVQSEGRTESFKLTPVQQKTLLEIARNSVENYVRDGQIPQFKINDPVLNQPRGAFVTLKKHGQLRGCIGRFEPDIPLYQVVSQMAIAAATQDIRFYPVQPEELGDLEYEISVLSPLRKIDDWREIEIGRHGVQIRYGLRSGVFLPQVATENNWDLEEFMGNLCQHKAGLPRDCWKNREVDIYIFTAEIFGEE